MFHRKLNEKSYEFETKNVTLQLEPGWFEYVFEDATDAPISFGKEKGGVGALQISLITAKNEENFDINEQLRINNQDEVKEIKQYVVNGWKVFEFEKTRNDNYTKYFYLVKPKIVLFVTYNVDVNKINKKELEEAERIIKTIKVVSNN